MPISWPTFWPTFRTAWPASWRLLAALLWIFGAGGALALSVSPAAAQQPLLAPQTASPLPSGFAAPQQFDSAPDQPKAMLLLSAFLSATDTQPLRGGLTWRVYDETALPDGTHKLVAKSTDPAPSLALAAGTYIVHADLGLAGMTKKVIMNGQPASERLVLNAGALRVVSVLGDKPINPAKLTISIYVSEPGNSEAKLVLATARSGEVIGLPEGAYHIVSTLLDTAGMGTVSQNSIANSTNSIVHADLRVQAGKLTDATLHHRAAVITLKLVSAPGGDAIANTAFTILTPGGDVIRELIGAFPSLVLAEGEYVVIARHDNKTFQADFKVESTKDRDVDVLMK